MRIKTALLLALMALLLSAVPASAQRVALKTNAVDWLLCSPNAAMEFRLSDRLTFDLGVAVNPFSSTPYGKNIKLQNFRFNPEIRYWFNRPMARHFVGVALTGGSYNLKFNDHYYKGDIAAAGVTYGYSLVLGRHWNVEFSLGIGVGRTWGYDYRGESGKPDNNNVNKWILVPIRTGVSFSYFLK